jgi:hypothetical protein
MATDKNASRDGDTTPDVDATKTNGMATAPIPAGSRSCVKRAKPSPGASVAPRLVFGYLRLEEPDEAEIAQLRAELASFCLGQGFHLGGVFCDRGVRADVTSRVGFAGALEALQMPESFALLVPSREHLSTVELVEQALVRKVNRTGCRVLALPATSGSPVEVS